MSTVNASYVPCAQRPTHCTRARADLESPLKASALQWMAGSVAFVYTSLAEEFGLSLIEAPSPSCG